MKRESMNYDVVIVGAGPAGLTAAIRLRQQCAVQGSNVSVCVVEKGSEVGAHILSGAVIETRALEELFPNWHELGAPLRTSVSEERFLFLTTSHSFRLPTPPQMRNQGNYIVSLGALCRWLAEKAEELGADIYPGFAAADVVYGDDGSVTGVVTGDMGVKRTGELSKSYQPGVILHGRQTLLAEGCRGSLSEHVIDRYGLRDGCDPQTYGIGIKETWEVEPSQHRLGLVVHTVGWPLDGKTYGGSFLYHLENNQVAVGFVVGLDYQNPFLSPYDEFQRFKHHPAIRDVFKNGRRISFGARALNEGGFQSIPKLTFPGGALIGAAAGFMNVPKIKGAHTAMKSAIDCADAILDTLSDKSESKEPSGFTDRLLRSWVWDELYRQRNIRPGFRLGLIVGLINAAIETYFLRGRAPWTFRNYADYAALKPAKKCTPINYPKHDGITSFDKLTNLAYSGTNHEEDQPSHLLLMDDRLPIDVNLAQFAAPEQCYCPANVYEIISDGMTPRLQINAQNCLHCKVCEIKDPRQNIRWTVPEGSGGPNYPNM
jgi:electron-transferring-flavoprotein dehydrogenase